MGRVSLTFLFLLGVTFWLVFLLNPTNGFLNILLEYRWILKSLACYITYLDDRFYV